MTEDVGAKDWNFQLHWTISGVAELVDSSYVSSNKANYVSCGVIITRALVAGDVISIQISSTKSPASSVTVDVENSTMEILRKF